MVDQPIAFVNYNTTVANLNFAIRVHGYNSTHWRMRSSFHGLWCRDQVRKGWKFARTGTMLYGILIYLRLTPLIRVSTMSIKKDDISRRMRSLGHVLVFSICCNTGTGTAGKAVPEGALNSHFEASGSASGYGIEKQVAGYTYTAYRYTTLHALDYGNL